MLESGHVESRLGCYSNSDDVRIAYLLHDLGKAHGFINARDGTSQLLQEGVLGPLHLFRLTCTEADTRALMVTLVKKLRWKLGWNRSASS